MLLRYDARGAMIPSNTGAYVMSEEYDRLAQTLAQVFQSAKDYLKLVEAREITADEAANALDLITRFSK